MSDLFQLFSNVDENAKKLMEDTTSVDHPQAVLFRACLQEQLEALDRLLPMLRDGITELEKLKGPISIIYQSNDVATPTYRAWERAIRWMKLPDVSIAKELDTLFPEMKKKLEEAGALLERIYGAEAVKYVVPSFYIPTVR